MSVPHLHALEAALGRRGWRVVAAHPGDGDRTAATWEVERGHGERWLIDFDGLGPAGDTCLPLAASYGCQARGRPAARLYFRRVRRSRELWLRELAAFVRGLDDAPPVTPGG
ncbi:MAG: hypothetical protein U0871_12525 [Gemmataceae bacterium]